MRVAGAAAGQEDRVVAEVVEAVGSVLSRHGPGTVTVTVEGAGGAGTARIGWQDGRLIVEREALTDEREAPASTAPKRPVSETTDQAAARLAELIRRDPSLLHRDGVAD
jgi:hypothetical protein